MSSSLDKSLGEIIRGYGPKRGSKRVSRGSGRRSVPYSSKSKHTDVFVGNVPYETTWQDLKDLCKEFGDVNFANILENSDGRSAGCGFVTFFNSSDAKACVKGLNGSDLDGRELNVSLSDRGSERRGTRSGRGNSSSGRGNSSKSKHTDVFVGNVPYETTWQDLKDLCKEFGDVNWAEILENSDGRSSGCGFVSFFNSQDAEACVEGLDGHELDGRELNVSISDRK